MKINIPYDPPNWNEYIECERANKYKANALKQKEKKIVANHTKGQKYTGGVPMQVTVRPHFKNKRKDLDNTRVKGLIDGLVSAGVIPNDNLVNIQKLIIEPVFDNEVLTEIEIVEVLK